jgi:hypothetical protein
MKDAFWTILKVYCSSVGLDFGESHLLVHVVDSNVSDIEWKIKGYKEFISPE